MAQWMTTLTLPGVEPMEGTVPGGANFAGQPYVDPSFIDLENEAAPFSLPANTDFFLDTDREGAINRAWRMRGFRTVTISGAVRIASNVLGTTGGDGLTPSIGFAITHTDSEPSSESYADFTIFTDSVKPSVRSGPPDLELTTNVATAGGIAGTLLLWDMPNDGEKIDDATTGLTAFATSYPDASGSTVSFKLRVRATFTGSPSCARRQDGGWDYPCILGFTLTAEILPVDPFAHGPYDGTVRFFLGTAEAGFDALGVNIGDATYDLGTMDGGVVLIYNQSSPVEHYASPGVFSTSEWSSVSVEFSDPIERTPPAPL